MRTPTALVLGLCASGSLAAATGSSQPDCPTVTISNGNIEGFHLGGQYDQELFLGIPYAQPPLGPLRFARPLPLNKTFGDTLKAKAYSPACLGYGGDEFGYDHSEDCLTLNVVRPAGLDYETEKLPVAVWIHGGGYVEGGSSDKRYNLTFIVDNAVKIKKPFVAVSLNYRLSAWGWLGSKEMAAEGATNLGLRDQRLALQWVQDNVEAFGGDKLKVTIWGESAGAGSVGAHLVAYAGRNDGLFRGAVMESGGPLSFFSRYYRPNTTAGLQPLYDGIAADTNCTGIDSLSCLRALPWQTLNAIFDYPNGGRGDSFNPYIDGDILAELSSIALTKGNFVKVPVLTGANSDEGTSASQQDVETVDDFVADIRLAGLTEQQAQEVLSVYPDNPCEGIPVALNCTRLGQPFGAQYRRSAAYFGDVEFIAQRRFTAQIWAKHGVPVYSYRFNTLPHAVKPETGVSHFQEVAFVFYNLEGLGYDANHFSAPPFQDEPASYEVVSRQMSYSWASFFVDQDVNTWRGSYGKGGKYGKSKGWPRYVLDKDGLGHNFVWDAVAGSHAEYDNWRKDGIGWINRHAADVYGR